MNTRTQRDRLPAMMNVNGHARGAPQARNAVQLAGAIAAEPRDVGGGTYVFPLAIPHERQTFTDYPPVVARWSAPPIWARTGTRVAISGWLRTRNLTRPLRVELRALARRAGMDAEAVRTALDALPEAAECRRVVVEVVAESVTPLENLP